MAEHFEVSVGSGSLCIDDGIAMAHPWTGAGVTVQTDFTGAHLLHLSVAGCVLNDVYREAQGVGIQIDGVRVTARGGFDEEWASTGITYDVAVDSAVDAEDVERLLKRVDEVAEIPKTIRAAAVVHRDGHVPQAGLRAGLVD